MDETDSSELASIRRLLMILVVLAIAGGAWFAMHSADQNAKAKADRMIEDIYSGQ